MKKTKVSILACATLMAASTLSFGATGTVNTDTARIRSKASSESSIVDLLSIDDKVEVLEATEEWYKIKTEEKTGFISKSLLDVDGAVETEVTSTSTEEKTENTENLEEKNADNNETEKKEENTSKVQESYVGKVSSEVTIKILPSINSTNIAKIEKDTDIKIVEVINDWCHIETSKFSGWARVKIVETALETASEQSEVVVEEPQEETTVETKVGYVNVDSVNLRADKSTESEKLDSITKNTEVTILADEGEWYKVKFKELTGYILKQYISDNKVEEVTSRASDSARQILENKNTDTNTEEEISKTATHSSSEGAEVVAFAKQYLGYDYVSGGSSPSTGFDCSGFTSYVYKNFGISLERTSSGQRSDGVAVSKSELEQGDILCFTGHVGIYIGDNQFIHASNPTGGVKITSLSDSYYVKNYITARRVLE